MNTLIQTGIVLLLLASFACTKEADLSTLYSGDEAIVVGSEKAAAMNSKSSADIFNMNSVVMGTSTLHRTNEGLTGHFKTNGLIAGNAYTMWWVIFGNPSGPPIITYAAGHVAGASGIGNFSSHFSVGEGFNNPLTAQVRLVLRTHGPVQPGMVPDQIHTINGGCLLPDIGYPSGPILYPDSDVVGYCANIQRTIHPAK